MTSYPIIYDWGFVVFWGVTLLLGIYGGGFLGGAFVMGAMLMLVWHEHAHASVCLRVGAPIKEIRFAWYGGYVMANVSNPSDIVDFFLAGVKNTTKITTILVALVAGITIWGIYFASGFNFAHNPLLNFINSLASFAILMTLINVLPISFHIKKYDVIVTTDWWAAHRYTELRDELWNDGKTNALEHPVFSTS